MNNVKKSSGTVFFGPFVGEFGWELLYWHGWVKRLCRGKYRNYHKIACSFPGRYPFYPDVDEFWSLPDKILKHKISSRGYMTDNWIDGFPKPSKPTKELVDVSPLVKDIIAEFKKKFPKGTEMILPWELRFDEEDKMKYGVEIPDKPKSDAEFVTHFIPFQNQILEPLKPTDAGKNVFEKMAGAKEKLICVFPRHRPFRRPDKDWTREKYEILIERLQKEFPQFKIAILGEPGGAFFAEGVPHGCLDIINVDPKKRMDIQLAALERSVLAIGGQSGGTAFALAAGCPTFTWGGAIGEKGFKEQNYLGTKLVFYTATDPPVDLIVNYAKWMLGLGSKPRGHELKRTVLVNLLNRMPRFVRKSKIAMKIKKFLRLKF